MLNLVYVTGFFNMYWMELIYWTKYPL